MLFGEIVISQVRKYEALHTINYSLENNGGEKAVLIYQKIAKDLSEEYETVITGNYYFI